MQYILPFYQKVIDNFNSRLEYAEKEFERHCTDEYSRDLCMKLLNLYQVSKNHFLFFFQNIMHWSELESIEGLEHFNSFIGNFLDDSYCRISYDREAIRRMNDTNRLLSESLDLDYKMIVPRVEPSVWVIQWCSDEDDDRITKQDLINIIDRLIQDARDHEIMIRKNAEWDRSLEDLGEVKS